MCFVPTERSLIVHVNAALVLTVTLQTPSARTELPLFVIDKISE